VMDCGQLAPFYDEYALGVLEGAELAELQAHLKSACPRCTPGVAQARSVVSQLAYLAPEAQPSDALRGNILQALQSSPMPVGSVPGVPKAESASAAFPAWAWVAAAALALITGYTIRQMGAQNAQLATLRREVRMATLQNKALQDELERDRMVASVMLSPDSKSLKLMPNDKAMPMVHAYLHPHMGVAITADAMPAMTLARTLQLWFIPKKGQPMSVAIFRPDSQGLVSMVAPVPMPMNEIAALAVTEEPAGGSPQPTSSPAWMAQIN
jgi:anti-sigma-K factor RskA